MMWQTVLASVLGNATVLAVLGWIGKTLIEKRITADTKRLEADLKSRADLAIEQLKSDLQLRSHEHQVKFSRLHEKRAEVISDVYSRLSEAIGAGESFLQLLQDEDVEMRKKYNDAMAKFAELYRFFDKHRLYLPESACVLLEKIIRDTRLHIIKLGVYLSWNDESLQAHTLKEKQTTWFEGWTAISEQIPLVRRELENEFRSLLS